MSIPQLSLPDTEEATARPAPKVLQLQGRNRLASGYSKLAIVSFVIAFLGPVGFLPAIVCAHLAKWQMRRNPGIRGESLATAALAIGYTSGLLTGVFAARNLLRKL